MTKRMNPYLLIASLAVLFTAFLYADVGPGLVSSMSSERESLLADPQFIPDQVLADLVTATEAQVTSAALALGVDQESLLHAARRAKAIIEYRRRRAGQEQVDESGCTQATGGPFESSLSRSNVPISSFEEVLARAHAVLHGRVTSVEKGFVANRFGTLVRFEVIENLGPHLATAQSGDKLDYVDRRFSIEILGERFCASREGFFQPSKGDEVLVLTAPPADARSKYKYRPSLIFPVQGEKVFYQPYGYLSEFDSIDLQEAKSLILKGAGNGCT